MSNQAIEMTADQEVRAALHGLRLPVLDGLTQSQLKDLSAHLRKIADYADGRSWAITADRVSEARATSKIIQK
jgi:hypothetical protein